MSSWASAPETKKARAQRFQFLAPLHRLRLRDQDHGNVLSLLQQAPHLHSCSRINRHCIKEKQVRLKSVANQGLRLLETSGLNHPVSGGPQLTIDLRLSVRIINCSKNEKKRFHKAPSAKHSVRYSAFTSSLVLHKVGKSYRAPTLRADSPGPTIACSLISPLLLSAQSNRRPLHSLRIHSAYSSCLYPVAGTAKTRGVPRFNLAPQCLHVRKYAAPMRQCCTTCVQDYPCPGASSPNHPRSRSEPGPQPKRHHQGTDRCFANRFTCSRNVAGLKLLTMGILHASWLKTVETSVNGLAR